MTRKIKRNNKSVSKSPVAIRFGDCIDVMRKLPDNYVDSVVTDPPYELGFMGKAWDSSGIAYNADVWADAMRVLKPGGYLLCFGGTRTFHRVAVAIEDVGFEIRDSIAWMHGQGFPKSTNAAKQLAKVSSEEAARWDGWGTGLKPSFEPIIVARKPLDGTIAANIMVHGTGAMNIDACRIGSEEVTINTFDNGAKPFGGAVGESYTTRKSSGRWPANAVLSHLDGCEIVSQVSDVFGGGAKGTSGFADGYEHDGFKASNAQTDVWSCVEGCQVAELDSQSKISTSRVGKARGSGGASRFFYTAKANKKERVVVDGVSHPTVKPLALMQWLVRLCTPPNGIVLDPFAGSGTTAEACIYEGVRCIAIEQEPTYIPLIEARIERSMSDSRRQR